MLSILIGKKLIRRVRPSRLKHLNRIKPDRRYNVGKVRVDLVCGKKMRVLERSSCSRRGFVRWRHRDWGYRGGLLHRWRREATYGRGEGDGGARGEFEGDV